MGRSGFVRCMVAAVLFGLLVSSQTFSKGVELRFMWWGSDSRHKVYLAAIDSFQAKNPDITIKAEYAGWTGYNEKLTTAIMGGNAADILQVNWNMLFMLGGKSFYDIKKTKINLKNYSDELINQCTIDKRVVGIPIGTNGRLFYFNKNTYDKAGVAIPQSFADMFKAAEAFKTKLGAGNYPILLEDYSAWLVILYYLEQKLGKPFIVNNKVAYTVDELKSGYDFYLDLVAKGVTPSIAETQSAGVVPYDQEQKWISGAYGGLYEWSASAGKVKGSVKDAEIVCGGIPMDYGKKPALMSKITFTLAINAKTKYAKESEKFLNWFLTDPVAQKVMALERGIPANKEAMAVLEKEGLLKGLAYEAQKVVDKGAGMGISPKFEDPEIQKFYRDVLQELGPKIDSKAAATKMIEKVNAYLEENK